MSNIRIGNRDYGSQHPFSPSHSRLLSSNWFLWGATGHIHGRVTASQQPKNRNLIAWHRRRILVYQALFEWEHGCYMEGCIIPIVLLNWIACKENMSLKLYLIYLIVLLLTSKWWFNFALERHTNIEFDIFWIIYSVFGLRYLSIVHRQIKSRQSLVLVR